LYLQKKELSEAREQVARQQAESQFYNMLNLQQQVVQGLDLQVWRNNAQIVVHGRDCFRQWGRDLINAYHKNFKQDRPDMEAAVKGFDEVLSRNKGDLGLYFRSLYSVFRFIESTAHDSKHDFGRVVRSLLSDYELVLLFYNSFSAKGLKFKDFAIKYELFDNLDVALLVKPEHVVHMEYKAYKGNPDALAIYRKYGASGSLV